MTYNHKQIEHITQIANMMDLCQYRGERARFDKIQDLIVVDRDIVVVFGASDDLVEMIGAIEEEFGSGNIVIDPGTKEPLENDCTDDCPYFKLYHDDLISTFGNKIVVRPHFCENGVTFDAEIGIPFRRFTVLDGEDIYGYGIVFDISMIGDMPRAQ